jgi:molecular chaperone DnaK (HSP70)
LPTHWAFDFGTSNTTICEDHTGEPHIVNLQALAKEEPLTQTPVIPSAVCILDPHGGSVLIGQEAMGYNWDGASTGFAQGFKLHLGSESARPMAQVEGVSFTCREVTGFFFRELIGRLEAQYREPVSDVTVAVPMGFYETYRAELHTIFGRVKRASLWQRVLSAVHLARPGLTLRFLDEPVAAALGYGVNVGHESNLVAFDFGGGSLEIAAVRTQTGATLETGRASVLAKQSLRLGGGDVDAWIVEKFAPEALREATPCQVALKWEAERVKLLASAGQVGTFAFKSQSYGSLDYRGLSELLAERGLYQQVQEALGRLTDDLRNSHGLEARQVDEVILEGGSTLLPEVRTLVGDVFGREKVREWLPFESVARGACVYAGGAHVEDFVYHDYALRVLDDKTTTVEYELLIPRGTRYPTAEDFATRYYTPGYDGQKSINLFISEVGRVAGRPVDWQTRANGTDYFAPKTEGEHAFCICLNEGDEALPLNPPGSGTAPRLRVTYCVNADRWLCVSVYDLLRKADLKVKDAVVRLR